MLQCVPTKLFAHLKVLTIGSAATDCQNRLYKPSDSLESSYALAGGLSSVAARSSSSITPAVITSGTTSTSQFLPPPTPPLTNAMRVPSSSESSAAGGSTSSVVLPTPSLSLPVATCSSVPIDRQVAASLLTSSISNVSTSPIGSSQDARNEIDANSGNGVDYISPPASVIESPVSVNSDLSFQDVEDLATRSLLNPGSYNLVGSQGSAMITGELLGLQGICAL